MLRELLALIAAGGRTSREDMARELGLRAPEVDDMLAKLLSLGYIEDLAAACSACYEDGGGKAFTGCASCPSRGAGGPGSPCGTAWP